MPAPHHAAMSNTTLNAANRLSTFLGYFSIGLGTFEAVAPQVLANWLGLKDRAGLLRLYGLREIGAGGALLTQTTTTGWMWARVAGDAVDIATLAVALNPANPKRGNAQIALAAVLGITALDLWTAIRLQQHDIQVAHPDHDKIEKVDGDHPAGASGAA